MKLYGKCSSFGGPDDKGMATDTGVALYEAAEASLRADLFLPAQTSDPLQPTWQRLREDAFYIALRFDHKLPREALKANKFYVSNPALGQFGFIAQASLVDWGPGIDTGRTIDCSPGLLSALGVCTNAILCVESDWLWV